MFVANVCNMWKLFDEKKNGTRLLSPENEFTSCLISRRTTEGLGSYEIRKIK